MANRSQYRNQVAKARRILRQIPSILSTKSLSRMHGVTLRKIDLPQKGIFTNPSLVWDQGKITVSVREVSYTIDWRGRYLNGTPTPWSTTWLGTLQAESLQVEGLRPIAEQKDNDSLVLEDPRLFVEGGQLRAVWATRDYTAPEYKVEIAVSSIDGDSISDVTVIPSPYGRALEKNWMPYLEGESLGFLYWPESLERYSYEGGKLRLTGAAVHGVKELHGHSGSSQLVRWRDGWLCVTHKYSLIPIPFKLAAWRFYRHQFVYFSADFGELTVSKSFHFLSRGIEFCSGLALDEGRVLVGFGYRDSAAYVGAIDNRALDLLFAGSNRVTVSPAEIRPNTSQVSQS